MVYRNEDYEPIIEELLDDIRRNGISAAIDNVNDPYAVALLRGLAAMTDNLSNEDYKAIENRLISTIIDLYPGANIRTLKFYDEEGNLMRELFLDDTYGLDVIGRLIHREYERSDWGSPYDFWDACDIEGLTAKETETVYQCYLRHCGVELGG